MMFDLLDLNKDKLICETDIFRVIKSIKSGTVSNLILADVLLVVKKINMIRKE